MEGYQTPPIPHVAGPSRVGQIGAIAIGAYTEIVGVYGPSEAAAGDLVTIEVRVKNLHSGDLAVNIGGYLDGATIWFSPDYEWIDPGATYSFTYSFTMPNHDVSISVWSYYWTGIEWYADDDKSVVITLAAPPEVYVGTITRLELEYGEAQASTPVYDIPVGQRGLVHIWGRNDTSIAQKLGIFWVIKDPDGIVVEEYFDWETFSTGPGDEHEFIGGRFNLDKAGTYMISAGLLMNPDNPIFVHTVGGVLCTVGVVVPEPEFRSFGVTEYATV